MTCRLVARTLDTSRGSISRAHKARYDNYSGDPTTSHSNFDRTMNYKARKPVDAHMIIFFCQIVKLARHDFDNTSRLRMSRGWASLGKETTWGFSPAPSIKAKGKDAERDGLSPRRIGNTRLAYPKTEAEPQTGMSEDRPYRTFHRRG